MISRHVKRLISSSKDAAIVVGERDDAVAEEAADAFLLFAIVKAGHLYPFSSLFIPSR